MAADFVFSESNGVGEVVTDDIANVNFGSVDDVEIVPANYPVIAGEASFEKYIRGFFSGTFTEISNMKFWKDSGDYVEGESIKASANAVYAQPSDSPNADEPIPTTEGTALSILSAEGESTIEYGASGVSGYTGYIRLQTQSTGETPAGLANEKEFILQYDEV